MNLCNDQFSSGYEDAAGDECNISFFARTLLIMVTSLLTSLLKVCSDHDLVLTTIKFKLKTECCMKSPRIQFDLEKLKNSQIG